MCISMLARRITAAGETRRHIIMKIVFLTKRPFLKHVKYSEYNPKVML